jgi:long-chain acyl-CoA synthetase
MNNGLPEVGKVRRFVNLFKEFDADDDELTRPGRSGGLCEQRYQEIRKRSMPSRRG